MQRVGRQQHEVGQADGCRGIPAHCFPALSTSKQGKCEWLASVARCLNVDGRHLTTGHGQPPRPHHVFVDRAIAVDADVNGAHEHPCPLSRLVGNCVDFAIFIRKRRMKLGG